LQKKDVIVIGAGAAGLLCAIEAGKRGRKTVVLESSEKPGNKILISGGGRCNFTNINTHPECFISENPHFCKSALARYSPNDFIALVEKHRIKYHEKKLGQLFCDGSAKEIVNMLVEECRIAGVEIVTNCNVRKISPHPQPLSKSGEESFSVITNQEEYISESLVIATGGVSIPQMGATDFGYMRAKQFDISLTEVKPGLVPLTFNKWKFSDLSGVSIDAIVSCNNIRFRENILFTHRGLSGPAILQISNYWNQGDAITINLLPDKNFEEMLIKDKASRIQLDNFLSQHMPKRFADKFSEMYFQAKPLYKLKETSFPEIAEKIHNWIVKPSGTEGFQKAEITIGGVNTDELSSKTMESKKVKGLYFIGEVVDVTGWLGGYNFQWAWASGFAAGQYV
jgi:predicted Rossmann fold flavoprotein